MFSLPTAQVVQPSCSMPLFVWLTSSQDIGNKEPPHDGGWNAASATKSLQSCPTLCDPVDGSPPGSSVPGILQARVLEWGAIAFSGGWTEVDQNNKDKILLHWLVFQEIESQSTKITQH